MRVYLILSLIISLTLPFGEAVAQEVPTDRREPVAVNLQEAYHLAESAQIQAAQTWGVPLKAIDLHRRILSGGHPWMIFVPVGDGQNAPIYPSTYQEALSYLDKIQGDDVEIGAWQINYGKEAKALGYAKEQLLDPNIAAAFAAKRLSERKAVTGREWNIVASPDRNELYRRLTAHVKYMPTDMKHAIPHAQALAAAFYGSPNHLLTAIKRVESKGHPWAICINLGKRRSKSIYPTSYQQAVKYLSVIKTDNIDIGPWQVNYKIHGIAAGASRELMLNPYVTAMLAAHKLASEIKQNGYTWSAVGNYHSKTPDLKAVYVNHLKKALRKEGYVAYD